MTQYQEWMYSDMPPHISDMIFSDEKNIVIVGVIGKSAFPDCNKMVCLNVLHHNPQFIKKVPKEGQIQFYYSPTEHILYLHFYTTFDAHVMQGILKEYLEEDKYDNYFKFNQHIRGRFARMLLFATQVCHIVIFVELSVNFDASLLSVFKSLKIIRDRFILKFLPKLLKNSSIGLLLGKTSRLCAPRFLFFFENYPDGYGKDQEDISKLEFEIEDSIYKMLRTEYVITNNSANSLFAIPNNKRFVYFNTNEDIRKDPLEGQNEVLNEMLKKKNFRAKKDNTDIYPLAPRPGYGLPIFYTAPEQQSPDNSFTLGNPQYITKSYINNVKSFSNAIRADYFQKCEYMKVQKPKRTFMELLMDHVNEALITGFDDNLTKFRGKSHFVIVNAKVWYEVFKVLHKIFIENPDNPKFEANDPDYKAYLENFNRMMDNDNRFFKGVCELALRKGVLKYNNPTCRLYGAEMHEKLLKEAIHTFRQYARGPLCKLAEMELVEKCQQLWENGRQQCEYPSLRGNPCVRPKHEFIDSTSHMSGQMILSACNCGHMQGQREDPYSLRMANYDFYEYMAENCNYCIKVEKIKFPIFEPSIHDYKAAEVRLGDTGYHKTPPDSDAYLESSSNSITDGSVEYDNETVKKNEEEEDVSIEVENFNLVLSQPLSCSANIDLSLGLLSNFDYHPVTRNKASNTLTSVNELIVQPKECHTEEAISGDDEAGNSEEHGRRKINRQASTTEFLPGMQHTLSPRGLLPTFPSWSLACLGCSSIYSHNTGIQEHFQSGFLSGSHYLLPWDVQVRMEHSAVWANVYDRHRYRRVGEVFVLKIFIGYEYECPRGHRFMMASPDKVLRGSGSIMRDSGSKVVFNNMPLYFPCPCHTKEAVVAQLMRVHVVTPKAPVDVTIDPKVQTGEDYTFCLGLSTAPKLTQSAYWVLRLPYVYESQDGPIMPPKLITPTNTLQYGFLQSGMFGVREMDVDDV